MIPVNIVEISFHSEVRPELRDANILQWRMKQFRRQRKWESGFAGKFRSVEEHELIDNVCCQSGAVEVAAGFEEDAENVAATEFFEDEA
jgi:hypothetical protein